MSNEESRKNVLLTHIYDMSTEELRKNVFITRLNVFSTCFLSGLYIFFQSCSIHVPFQHRNSSFRFLSRPILIYIVISYILFIHVYRMFLSVIIYVDFNKQLWIRLFVFLCWIYNCPHCNFVFLLPDPRVGQDMGL